MHAISTQHQAQTNPTLLAVLLIGLTSSGVAELNLALPPVTVVEGAEVVGWAVADEGCAGPPALNSATYLWMTSTKA